LAGAKPWIRTPGPPSKKNFHGIANQGGKIPL
jgi:hypothetical protein